ncbi:MAG: M1 family aminopeptidase [Chitinophagaceae bacterium]
MRYLIVYLLLFFCFVTEAIAQPVETGVSYALAMKRKELIKHPVYTISFHIPAEKTESITGYETISFDLGTITDSLQIDFKQDAAHVKLVRANGKDCPVVLHNEHLLIAPALLHNGNNNITIDFIAGNESLNRNNDYLYALFVPDRARTVFPCFDQPNLKAVFNLSLTVPASWQVLANASVKDSLPAATTTLYHFNASDTLPTYLFSFTAGKYTVANQSNMRFLYRETDTAKIRLSVDSIFQSHRDAIAFLEEWTGIRFPFQKIGFVAIPAFQFGGMEHPGEVQYNAPGLFLDAGATKDQHIARNSVISHETAHMWFGDMVTMQWFNDVWMKEVFANFMADKVAEKLMGSETFNQKFLLDHTPAAYGVDRTPGANPIRQQLDNLREAGTMYGNIIYHKAPVMMRQLELLMGKDAFRKGIQEYLNRYRYSNANWDDLIAILAKYTSADLISWNKVWAYRPGRPVFQYKLNKGKITITQNQERWDAAIWPQQFDIALVYADTVEIVPVNMNSASISLPLKKAPDYMVFNAGGQGYGLFPAVVNKKVYALKSPLQRAAAYINAYENMLAANGIKPAALLDFFKEGLTLETNELNLRLIAGYAGNIFWTFLKPEERKMIAPMLEPVLWTAIDKQSSAGNKKILFQCCLNIYSSKDANSKFYTIWQTQQAPAGVILTEDDYIAIATTLAIKTDTVNHIIEQQLTRISNADRKARLQFIAPALSIDSTTRDNFFESLKEIANRRKEAWVSSALSYMNHPLRQKTFIKHLPETLDMLEEIQQTGDIFFPQNWLGSIFGNYQSAAAWQVVDNFLQQHPAYNPKLKAKILQTTDNLYRAVFITGSH